MARAKATHKGHCQVCGCKQKLPGGLLAKHGYQVAGWGFFNGTCYGSDNLPFERDISMIEGAIRSAEGQKATLIQLAVTARATTDSVWVHEYKPATWENRHSSYEWRLLPLAETTRPFSSRIAWTGRNGKQQITDTYAEYGTDQTPVSYCNERRAKDYDSTIKEVERYIKWQNERIVNWQPHDPELIPVK